MATYNRNALVNAVLQHLSITDPNQTPSAKDYQTADAVIQQQLEYLYTQGFIPFDLDGLVPARYFRPLVKVIAPELVPAFGLDSRAQTYLLAYQDGMDALRKLRDDATFSEPTQAEYY